MLGVFNGQLVAFHRHLEVGVNGLSHFTLGPLDLHETVVDGDGNALGEFNRFFSNT